MIEGTIFLLGPLDFEKQSMYHLSILANVSDFTSKEPILMRLRIKCGNRLSLHKYEKQTSWAKLREVTEVHFLCLNLNPVRVTEEEIVTW